ncbi:MAG: polysaccharide deacetylase family protein [Sphingomonadaceae bacterium]|nr:polysaccharide deacetylase family protein [Sphingomonadaceae bacterium]
MLAPSEKQYISFGPEFGQRVLVFVDTEEEFDWTQPKSRDSTSVKSVKSLPKVHSLMRGFGIKPAYMVDYPVATTAESVEVLRALSEGEGATIGAQLHPWVNPPFIERVGGLNSFPGNLPREVERAKIKALTDAIAENFGAAPIVYRAGRYGVGPNTEALLDELGYRMDVSVRPYFDYSDEGGPSFRGIRPQLYWTGPERRLLELPLTSTFTGGLRVFGERAFELATRVPRLNGLLSRTSLLGRVALTPEGIPLDEAIQAIELLVEAGTQIFSISFHSPSVEPGHTPYVRDARDLADFYAWWDGVLTTLTRAGVKPAGVEEIVAAAHVQRDGNAPAALAEQAASV